MDVDYCLTCQCHFEAGPWNPYCSIQCRPASSTQHFVDDDYHTVDDIDQEDEQPFYHYVQDTSFIRQWAAAIPEGPPPTDVYQDHQVHFTTKPSSSSSSPSRHSSPSPSTSQRSRSRPKLLTSLSKPPSSTTGSTFQHADVLSSSPSSESSTPSLATPTSPAFSSKMIELVKSWVGSSSPNSNVHENMWWTQQTTSQQCQNFFASSDEQHYLQTSHSTPSKPMAISSNKKIHPQSTYECSYVPQPRYLPSRGRL